MMNLFSRIRYRLGDFWWYTALLFFASRCGDLINAFIGLWLVPQYVSQDELGAVLPLMQVTNVFGLPISILVIVFTKFLNHYQTLGENGKVKSLICMFWSGTVCAIVCGIGMAFFLMPHFFDRIRVATGSLGVLIVLTAVLSTTSPVFTNALQALKKFRAITLMNVLSAPIRLLVMLVAMPFRALSGYMLGQAAPQAFLIISSWLVLRGELRSDVPSKTFWREDWRRILSYTGAVTVAIGIPTLISALLVMVLRQRLPDVESAGYYMISRFSELASYAGMTILFVAFPFAAEAQTKGKDNLGLLVKSEVGLFAFGILGMLGLWLFGRFILSVVPSGRTYIAFAPDMVLLALSLTLSTGFALFVNIEMASMRFAYCWYSIPIYVLQLGIFACFSGYSFFEGYLPPEVVKWMASCQMASLHRFVLLSVWANALVCFGAVIQVCWRQWRSRRIGGSLYA